MKKLLVILLFIPLIGNAQGLHKIFKYSTFYAAVNGGTSLGDDQIWSITSGTLEEQTIETPFDYTLSIGIRKIHTVMLPQLVESMALSIYSKLILYAV